MKKFAKKILAYLISPFTLGSKGVQFATAPLLFCNITINFSFSLPFAKVFSYISKKTKHNMAKLSIVDASNFILEGEFEKIKPSEGSALNEASAKEAVEIYRELALNGDAIGYLNDGFFTIETDQGEQVDETEKEPAFMVLDLAWEPYSKAVFGRIIILDSNDGLLIKKAISEGTNCYISSSETEFYTNMNKDRARVEMYVTELKNYKISLLKV